MKRIPVRPFDLQPGDSLDVYLRLSVHNDLDKAATLTAVLVDLEGERVAGLSGDLDATVLEQP